MVSVTSTMLELGTTAPDFRLPNMNPAAGGEFVSLADLKGAKALLVVFMCNHCPYVVHIRDVLVALVKEYQAKGVAMVGISANDVTTHPADGPEQMRASATEHGFTFPYLYDEDQAVAKAYRAACTPDLFLFDKDLKLVYRGQFDGARPRSDVPVTGADLRAALDAVLAGEAISSEQRASMGCNIKWRAGNEPEYFDAA